MPPGNQYIGVYMRPSGLKKTWRHTYYSKRIGSQPSQEANLPDYIITYA